MPVKGLMTLASHYHVKSENLLRNKGAAIFSKLGSGAEDFWQGYETFSHYFVGVREH